MAATVTWSGLENNPEPDLPLPTAEQMGLTGDAAAIFDALQARYADPEQIPVRSRANDVMLPSITIWDSYEADGDTVLVCSVNEMFYYGVQLDGTCDGWGGGGSPTAFRGRCDENGNFQIRQRRNHPGRDGENRLLFPGMRGDESVPARHRIYP